ncbi:MAG: acetyl-CoA carboxylase biotin carboxyl carrier protein subunit [Desulfovermiculus sp.]|nr:acetyl-CoA carboxylase biotin carboxyl carrier protein subunit [Desulfovermiculus sp.]
MFAISEVKAPMTGEVGSIHAQVGMKVRGGDILMTLEAMKMENLIRAPRSGVVIEILTTEGAMVHAGEILAVLDEALRGAQGPLEGEQ